MKPTIGSKCVFIVLYGFFGSPFLLVGLLTRVAWIALQTGWWWGKEFGELK